VKSEVAKHEKKLQEKAKLIEENTKRPPKKIGKYRVPKLPIDVQLSEDLSESLRTLKPEGNLFVDRMTSLQQRSIIEPRVPTKARRKRRRKATHDD
ncbi:6789_t:CDS:2, partial [Paraglomus occultum]